MRSGGFGSPAGEACPAQGQGQGENSVTVGRQQWGEGWELRPRGPRPPVALSLEATARHPGSEQKGDAMWRPFPRNPLGCCAGNGRKEASSELGQGGAPRQRRARTGVGAALAWELRGLHPVPRTVSESRVLHGLWSEHVELPFFQDRPLWKEQELFWTDDSLKPISNSQ